MLSVLLGAKVGLGTADCALLMEGDGDSHPPCTTSVVWNSPNHQHEQQKEAWRELPAVRGSRGAIHSIPAGAEHVPSSAGSQPPGQLRQCLVGARLFTADPLASPGPKQTDVYDPDHTLQQSWSLEKLCGHGKCSAQKGAAAEGVL